MLKLKNQERQIIISCSETIEFIYLNDILRCEGMINASQVFLKDGSKLISSNGIGDFRKSLSKFGFFSCHKSHVINSSCIKRYHKSGFIELIDESKVPLSRRRKDIFFKSIIHTKNISAENLQ